MINDHTNNTHLLTIKEASDYLGVTEGTLNTWRSIKRYNLNFVKVGRLVRYKQSDLDAFLDRRTVETINGK
jgi:excisionase family DNA binding protein